MPTSRKVKMTYFGVSSGCHAFRRCCWNAESDRKEGERLKEAGREREKQGGEIITHIGKECLERVSML
jgi:hypothetical protein